MFNLFGYQIFQLKSLLIPQLSPYLKINFSSLIAQTIAIKLFYLILEYFVLDELKIEALFNLFAEINAEFLVI
jgi:hypothetical protein